MRNIVRLSVVAALVLVCVGDMQAGVVMDTVAIGNPGNPGEMSGEGAGAGGYGPDRICGAVDHTFGMAKYEVTAGQYTAFLNAVAADDTYALYNTSMRTHSHGCDIRRTVSPDGYTYSVADDWANRPVNFISWGDAARFANWLHNGQPTGAQGPGTTEDGSYFLDGAMSASELSAVTREQDATWVIPSEDEWFKAAYHKNDGLTGNYFDYPTSSDSEPSNDLIDPDPGNNATLLAPGEDYTIGGPYWRTEVGAHENSASPYGTFDQAGNLWEWNEAIIGSSRGLRGASYCCGYLNGSHAAYRYDGGTPTNEHRNVGFRVVYVPEPATVALLSLGGLLAPRRRR